MASRSPELAMQADKELFLERLGDFFDQCKRGEEGRCAADIQFLASVVNRKVERVSQASSGVSHFAKTKDDRDKIIAKFYEELDKEVNVTMKVTADDATDARNAVIWALLQVCSEEVLAEIKDALDKKTEIPKYFTTGRKMADDLDMLLKIFFPSNMTTKQKAVAALSDAVAANKNNRDTSVPNKCEERDGHKCVVTKEKNPVVCHIFPISGGKMPETTRNALTVMWGKVSAENAFDKLFMKKIINTLANTICLSASMHAGWGRGDFAFMHIETKEHENGKWYVKLGFYWMKKETPNSSNLGQSAHDFLASLPRVPLPVRAFNVETNSPVIDGDVITIWADTEAELPHPQIIKIQWDIIRMRSLRGGAGANEEEEDDNDDDDEMVDAIAATCELLTGHEE